MIKCSLATRHVIINIHMVTFLQVRVHIAVSILFNVTLMAYNTPLRK